MKESSVRTIINRQSPFAVDWNAFYIDIPTLPCSWISFPNASAKNPIIMNFKLDFKLKQQDKFVLNVSSDQNYSLWFDDNFVGRGCDIKSPENWYFESYEITSQKGEHQLNAIVWNYGDRSSDNRMSIFPGFIVVPDKEHTQQLGTGLAPWKVKKVDGVNFKAFGKDLGIYISVAPAQTCDCESFFDKGRSSDWVEPEKIVQGINGSLRKEATTHCLVPSIIKEFKSKETLPGKAVFVADKIDASGYIPAMVENRAELSNIDSIVNKGTIVLAANSEKRIIFDLDDYYCGYSRIKVSKGTGAKIRVSWAEAAFTDPVKPTKSRRDVIEGKYFRGTWDEFILDGKPRDLVPLAWRAGRYIELSIVTSSQPVEIEQFTIRETRYPLKQSGKFLCDRKAINEIVPLCVRTLQVSSHDNFVDCPYYEQLPYTGDGRLEALANLVFFKDDTLVRKMLSIFSESRDLQGFTMSSWPRRVWNVIPSFSLSWIAMVHDYAQWRNDKKFIMSFMPAIRFLLDNVLARADDDGFVRGVDTAWNFIDWVDQWNKAACFHVPPGIEKDVNATYNWLVIYILGLAGKLERYAGELIAAERWEKTAKYLAIRMQGRFWDAGKGLFKEEDSGRNFSEHAQILAILSGQLPVRYLNMLKESLFAEKELAKCSIYYKHYFFEACRLLNLPEKILADLNLWHAFIEHGFKTVPETFENKAYNQRSDCHGWGSHPLYHLVTNIAGIQPAEMGFNKVLIAPMPAGLSQFEARCIHPEGTIDVKYSKENGKTYFDIFLPGKVSGRFKYGKIAKKLKPGRQSFAIK